MKKEKYLVIGHDNINDIINVNIFDDFDGAREEVDDYDQHLMAAIIIPFSKTKELIDKAQRKYDNSKQSSKLKN